VESLRGALKFIVSAGCDFIKEEKAAEELLGV
jgi:hypothetical protein